MISNGVDIIKIDRFNSLKNNSSFMNSIFSEKEIEYINYHNSNTHTIAGMYAAKEAFLKALKKGINNHSLKDIEISHDDNNAPFIISNIGDTNNISLSISHDSEYAIAFVSIIR